MKKNEGKYFQRLSVRKCNCQNNTRTGLDRTAACCLISGKVTHEKKDLAEGSNNQINLVRERTKKQTYKQFITFPRLPEATIFVLLAETSLSCTSLSCTYKDKDFIWFWAVYENNVGTCASVLMLGMLRGTSCCPW